MTIEIYDAVAPGRYRPRYVVKGWHNAFAWMSGEGRISISRSTGRLVVYRG